MLKRTVYIFFILLSFHSKAAQHLHAELGIHFISPKSVDHELSERYPLPSSKHELIERLELRDDGCYEEEYLSEEEYSRIFNHVHSITTSGDLSAFVYQYGSSGSGGDHVIIYEYRDGAYEEIQYFDIMIGELWVSDSITNGRANIRTQNRAWVTYYYQWDGQKYVGEVSQVYHLPIDILEEMEWCQRDDQEMYWQNVPAACYSEIDSIQINENGTFAYYINHNDIEDYSETGEHGLFLKMNQQNDFIFKGKGNLELLNSKFEGYFNIKTSGWGYSSNSYIPEYYRWNGERYECIGWRKYNVLKENIDYFFSSLVGEQEYLFQKIIDV